MSEVKQVKLTPNEIRTAKNAVTAEKMLNFALKAKLAAELAAAEAKQILDAKQSIAAQKEGAANTARSVYEMAVEKKVLAEQAMNTAKAEGDQARADAEAARLAKIKAAQETAAAKQQAIEQAKQRVQEAAALKLAQAEAKKKAAEEAAALKLAQAEAKKRAAEEAAAQKKAEIEAKRLAAQQAADAKKAAAETKNKQPPKRQRKNKRKPKLASWQHNKLPQRKKPKLKQRRKP